jgi:hypothetical protein
MGIFYQGDVGTAMLRQTGGGAVERRLLDIKGIDFARIAHHLGEPEGIVAVAHGEIDDGATLFDMGGYEIFLGIEQINHGNSS